MRLSLRRAALALCCAAPMSMGYALAPLDIEKEAAAEDAPAAPALAVPLAVEVVDADTGKALDAGWTADASLRPAYSSVRLSVKVPPGYLTWEQPSYAAQVSRRAASAVATCPLHRELDLTLDVRGPKGKVPKKSQVDTVELTGGGDRRYVPCEEVAAGRFRVRGVAVLRGESLTIRGGGSLPDRRGHDEFVWGLCTFLVPIQGEARVKAQLLLEPFEEPPLVEQPRDHHSRLAGRGITSTTLVRGRFRPNHKNEWNRQVEQVGTGPLRVVAKTSDGQPARGAWIEVRAAQGATKVVETDAQGEVTLEAPLGSVQVWLVEPGLVPAMSPAQVRKESRPPVEVLEPTGGALDVVVQTEDGRAVPFARLDVQQPSGEPWIDIANGVQRIDDFTDAEGRRSLRRIEPGTVEVYATWGLKAGMARVKVAQGKRTEVRIVARPGQTFGAPSPR